jgi:hypothetical protein
VKALPDAWAGRDSLACGPGRFPLGMGDSSCSSTTDGDPAHAIAPRSAEVGPLPPAGCDLPLAPDMTPWSVVRAF